MGTKQIFSERLVELRKEKGLTQRQLGKETSIHYAVIGNWETGKYSPNIESLSIIAKYFDVPSDYLIGLIDDY
ncbi:MAG: helix-turn-helix domain-containing protein [Firmicutes bacterium]|nr:helix-turn-helix domain-containing protein [Bacillota bacterium]